MAQLHPHPVTGDLFESPVLPGSGWPGDLATTRTLVAKSSAEVLELAQVETRDELDARISVCRACPRLVEWREEVALSKRASFAEQPYWGRPVPGWGAAQPKIVVLGLAPAANGANRTGRMFTGDSSGDWLYASLHRCDLASRATAQSAGDGQSLIDTAIIASVKCAPPDNKPTITERDSCAPWLQRELDFLLPSTQVMVALGAFGWAAGLRALGKAGFEIPRPKPKFGHGREVEFDDLFLLGSYHPSQHNTFTGRLTPEMMDEIFNRAKELAGLTASRDA
ncbi:MAG TPA: uracil-DNA glycosylase [Marmoricola sp.]|nr:uracil-DNA glycosylase [Nocardioidaceae bacterium]MCB8992522.1 uracil-DNA glycosylase [Nocardioidaceae bacterium]MCO5323614.1 uracil-DNA glycosylase [Nocardioidaceae bacterium]HRV67835.1 uracil-DNA glycosylase [Marmoricola sp.]